MGRLILRETIKPSVSTEKHSQRAMFSFISTCFLTADNIILSQATRGGFECYGCI